MNAAADVPLENLFLQSHEEAQESVRELAANHPSSGVEHHCKHQVGWTMSWYFALNIESRIQQGKHKALKLGWISWWRFLRASCYFCRSIYLFIFSHVERDTLRQTSTLSGSINSLESRRATACCSLTCALWLDENLFVMFVRCDRRAQ